jgi:hypothetical protein
MKSRWSKLKYQNYKDLTRCLFFFEFLRRKLNIDSADDLENAVDHMLSTDFCRDCETMKEDCCCRSEAYRDYDDGDRAYDAWKDSQLDDEP